MPNSSSNTLSVEAYVVISPKVDPRGKVSGASILKTTNTRPRKPVGFPMIKLRLNIPLKMLEGYSVVVNIPENGLGTIDAEVLPAETDQ